MNSEEIKKYVNGHVELMVEILLGELEDWSSMYSQSYEKDTGCSIVGTIDSHCRDWIIVDGRSAEKVERASLRMARKIAAQVISKAIEDGRTLNLRFSQSFGNSVIVDDEHGSTVLRFCL